MTELSPTARQEPACCRLCGDLGERSARAVLARRDGEDAADGVRDTERAGGLSPRRDCHFADIPSPSVLKHLLQVEGGAAE